MSVTSLRTDPCAIMRSPHCWTTRPDNEAVQAEGKSSSSPPGPKRSTGSLDIGNQLGKGEYSSISGHREESACSENDHPKPTEKNATWRHISSFNEPGARAHLQSVELNSPNRAKISAGPIPHPPPSSIAMHFGRPTMAIRELPKTPRHS